MRERVARPRRSSALSCVFAVVLALALAGSACALSVDIVLPEANPAEVAQYEEVRFEAVCRDSRGNDVTEKASFLWTFTETERPAAGNPVQRSFDQPGKFAVVVTATLAGSSGSDEITVIVVASDPVPMRVDEEDFRFFARIGTHEFGGGQVCDQVELVVEQIPPHVLPFEWYIIRFDRFVDGAWVIGETEGAIPPESSHIWETSLDPHEAVRWRAHLELDEVAADPPNTIIYELEGEWTPNNAVVKATGDPIILHHEEDTSHTISWNLTHYTDAAIDPQFDVTVTIHDLSGTVVKTLTSTGVEVGAGSVAWNTGLPAQDGIYTYKIAVSHDDDPPTAATCGDCDKSPRLTISNVTVADFEWIDLPTTAQVTLGYQLNRASANCRLRVFNHERDEVTVTAPAGGALSNTVGTHSLTVEFEDPDQIVGNYRFVVLADETANDGALNRDEQPKPATQKGEVLLSLPRASVYSDETHTIPTGLAAIVARPADGKHYVPVLSQQCLPGDATGVIASISQDAVFHLYGHGYNGAAIIGRAETPLVLVEKKWFEPGTILRAFADDVDLAADQHAPTYPNLLISVLQQCYTAKDAYDIGAATKAAVDLGAKSALGFEDLILLGAPGHTWMTTFYEYAIDPAHPQQTVGQAAIAAAARVWDEHRDDPVPPGEWPDATVGTGGYDGMSFWPTEGGPALQLLHPGVRWGE